MCAPFFQGDNMLYEGKEIKVGDIVDIGGTKREVTEIFEIEHYFKSKPHEDKIPIKKKKGKDNDDMA
jgi:hypothetical protein